MDINVQIRMTSDMDINVQIFYVEINVKITSNDVRFYSNTFIYFIYVFFILKFYLKIIIY